MEYYLKHHGIMGQKWGKQNGPPYPLDSKDHSSAEKKAGWRQSLTRMKTQNIDGSLNNKGLKRYQVNEYGYMSKKGLRNFKKDDAKLTRKYSNKLLWVPNSKRAEIIQKYLQEKDSSTHRAVRKQKELEERYNISKAMLDELNKNGEKFVLTYKKEGGFTISAKDPANRKLQIKGSEIVNSMEDIMRLNPLDIYHHD